MSNTTNHHKSYYPATDGGRVSCVEFLNAEEVPVTVSRYQVEGQIPGTKGPIKFWRNGCSRYCELRLLFVPFTQQRTIDSVKVVPDETRRLGGSATDWTSAGDVEDEHTKCIRLHRNGYSSMVHWDDKWWVVAEQDDYKEGKAILLHNVRSQWDSASCDTVKEEVLEEVGATV